MTQTNDSKLLEKVLSKATEDYSQDDAIMTLSTNNEMGITDFDSYKTGYLSGARRMQKEARLAERAKCIAQLKDHQAHCDNCAKDNIEMAIIILEKNEAIE